MKHGSHCSQSRTAKAVTKHWRISIVWKPKWLSSWRRTGRVLTERRRVLARVSNLLLHCRTLRGTLSDHEKCGRDRGDPEVGLGAFSQGVWVDPGGVWRRNYSSLAEYENQVLEVMHDQLLVLTESDARKQKPDLVIASLGAQRKEKPGSKITARVLFDGTRGLCANSRTRLRDQERAPVAADLKRAMREKARIDELFSALTADVTEARRQGPIHPDDWHLLGCQVIPGGEVFINTVGTFGTASASYCWQRQLEGWRSLSSQTRPLHGTCWLPTIIYLSAEARHTDGVYSRFSFCVQLLEFPYPGTRHPVVMCLSGLGLSSFWDLGQLAYPRDAWNGLYAGQRAFRNRIQFFWLRSRKDLAVSSSMLVRSNMSGHSRDRCATIHPGDAVRKILPYVKFILPYFSAEIKKQRHYPCSTRMTTADCSPRVDAQASSNRTRIGGWFPVADHNEELSPWLSEWFSLEIKKDDFPWIFEQGDRPSLVISTLEALAMLVALKLRFEKHLKQMTNGFLSSLQLQTTAGTAPRWTSSCRHISPPQLYSWSSRLIWRRGECEQLSNGHRVSSTKRQTSSPMETSNLLTRPNVFQWQRSHLRGRFCQTRLKQAEKPRERAYLETKTSSGLPNRCKRQRKRKVETRHKITDPWKFVVCSRPHLVHLWLWCVPSVYVLLLFSVRFSVVQMLRLLFGISCLFRNARIQVLLGMSILFCFCFIRLLAFLLGLLFLSVFVVDNFYVLLDSWIPVRVGKFKTSPLESALPSWSLIKSLSEWLSHDSSPLYAHQIPRGGSMPRWHHYGWRAVRERLLWVPPLRHWGCQGRKRSLCLCPPLRLRGRTGVFRRREGSSSQTIPGHSLQLRLAVRLFLRTRRYLMPRFAACGSVVHRVRFPFFVGFFFFVELAFSRGVHLPGQTDVWRSCLVRLWSWLFVPPGHEVQGGLDVFFPAATAPTLKVFPVLSSHDTFPVSYVDIFGFGW